jgi:hypothetical protein
MSTATIATEAAERIIDDLWLNGAKNPALVERSYISEKLTAIIAAQYAPVMECLQEAGRKSGMRHSCGHQLRSANAEEAKQDCCGDRYPCTIDFVCECGEKACTPCIEVHLRNVHMKPKEPKQ